MKKQIRVKSTTYPQLWVFETDSYYAIIKGTTNTEYYQKASFTLPEALTDSLGSDYKILDYIF
jgi:hypothetical protein